MDLHGRGMNARMLEACDRLGERGSAQGFIVIQPSATSDGLASWAPADESSLLALVRQAHRESGGSLHLVGFSQGASLASRLACATGADSVALLGGADRCLEEHPPPAVLLASGATDGFEPQWQSLVKSLAPSWSPAIATGGLWTMKDWSHGSCRLLALRHELRAALAAVGGHCIPTSDARQPPEGLALGCDSEGDLDWGALVLDHINAADAASSRITCWRHEEPLLLSYPLQDDWMVPPFGRSGDQHWPPSVDETLDYRITGSVTSPLVPRSIAIDGHVRLRVLGPDPDRQGAVRLVVTDARLDMRSGLFKERQPDLPLHAQICPINPSHGFAALDLATGQLMGYVNLDVRGDEAAQLGVTFARLAIAARVHDAGRTLSIDSRSGQTTIHLYGGGARSGG